MSQTNHRWHFGHTLGVALFIFMSVTLKLSQEFLSNPWQLTAGLFVQAVAWQTVAYAYQRGANDALKSKDS